MTFSNHTESMDQAGKINNASNQVNMIVGYRISADSVAGLWIAGFGHISQQAASGLGVSGWQTTKCSNIIKLRQDQNNSCRNIIKLRPTFWEYNKYSEMYMIHKFHD